MKINEIEKAYDTLLNCRNIDNKLFTTRFHLIIIVQTFFVMILGRALLTIKQPPEFIQIIIPILIILGGLIFSKISKKLIAGASFWVSYWELRLSKIEHDIHPSVKIFSNHPSKDNKKLLSELDKLYGLKYASIRGAVVDFHHYLYSFWKVVSINIFVLIYYSLRKMDFALMMLLFFCIL